MTAKEAIKTIEATKAEVEWNYPLDYAAAFEVAIEALEKQIPKKPVTEKDKVIFGIVCGRCPECDSAVYSTTNLYCHNCGQALDWSDTK